jgi:hypothetical protein
MLRRRQAIKQPQALVMLFPDDWCFWRVAEQHKTVETHAEESWTDA